MASRSRLVGAQLDFLNSDNSIHGSVLTTSDGILVQGSDSSSTIRLSGITTPGASSSGDTAANKSYVDAKFNSGISSSDVSDQISTVNDSTNLTFDDDNKIHLGQSITGLTTVSANTIISTSDMTLKQDIQRMSQHDALDIVNTLRPVHFRFISHPDQPRTGLVAQEVNTTAPALVHTIADGSLAVNYIDVIAYLLGAVQKLSRMVMTQKEEEEEKASDDY